MDQEKMLESGICPACDQKIRKPFPYNMNARFVHVLERMAHMHRNGICWVKMENGRLPGAPAKSNLLSGDPAKALRLKWFGLVRRLAKGTGLFRLKPAGWDFLAGNGTVPEIIWCKDGKVVKESTRHVSVQEVKDAFVDKNFWHDYWQLKRSEWELVPEA